MVKNQRYIIRTSVERAFLYVASRIAKAVGQPVIEAVLVTLVVDVAAAAPVARVVRTLPVKGVVVVLGSNSIDKVFNLI